ncbi:hypothetical protein C8A03DRAFT_33359 [Achaetomium macrosporum]|uniref:Extracellular membrane protein CFEM domain-containing protein n=1 Tax=Achaetomium macrosporum TaxID=79813 RepID=A0AAN7HBD5_9PEZI|nr:hypothetical protein C8A03DRAFT_33359 [Achaetomium macrosporum]
MKPSPLYSTPARQHKPYYLPGRINLKLYPRPMATTTILLLILATAPIARVAAQDISTLSIGTALNRSPYHACVTNCLVRVPLADNDNLETALGCATPVVNGCYCATSAAAVATAASFIPSCATLSCSRGDVGEDVRAIRDAYAQYCLAAGFTATGWNGWVMFSTPAPTPDDGDGMTTLTIPRGLATGVGVSVITTTVVDGTRTATSTITVDSSGSPIPASPASHDEDTGTVLAVGLGVGLGLGIPLLLAVTAIALLLWFRHKRQPRPQETAPVVVDGHQEVKPVIAASTTGGIGSPTIASTTPGLITPEELDGRALFQAPP